MSNLLNINSNHLDVKEKIEDITDRLHEIKSQTHDLGLSTAAAHAMQQVTSQSEALRNQRESSSVGSQVFGRNDKKQKILQQLLKDDQINENYAFAMIPIVGKGGIGKTTLAQYAFNNEQVKRHFDSKAWVCVSDVFDVTRITTTILRAITGGGSYVENSNLNEAQMKLKQALMGRKFLIVLDDIWNEEYDAWHKLQEPFKHAAKGSRVVMTTRNEEIARLMNTSTIHDNIIRLEGLSDSDCWRVFQQHANNDSDLAEMRDEIIKKCKGLPLAAKALGGLLKKTMDKRHHRIILDSNIWSEECSVLPVLRLSYHHLPSHLKGIFAYCSMFPKDFEFNEIEVVLLWMAQGFLPDNEQQNMKDLGHRYFADLVSRSLFEPSHTFGPIKFIMHDLIHDLAQWAAGGICYAKGTKDIAQVYKERLRLRHVYLIGDPTMQERQLIASQLRTVYVVGIITNLDFIHSLSYIRALSLASDTITVLPGCIGDLKHLRFLSLKFTRLVEFPKSIGMLWNLQTLLAECIHLKEFPDIGSLKELRYLDITSLDLDEMPHGIGKLTNLKSLGKFKLDNGQGFRVRELKNLNNLQGELKISGLQYVTKVEDAKEAQLHEKRGLDKLVLDWESWNEQVADDITKEVVEQLKPPTSIKKCELKGYLGLTLPGWLGDPCFNKIIKINLVGCKKCESLLPLGKLPCLKTLEIYDMDSIKQVGVEFYGCSNPFPVLKYLSFRGMECWEKWEHIPSDDDNIAFPCLERLEIIHCPSLKTVLEQSVMAQRNTPCEGFKPNLLLPALNYLKIISCDNLESLPCEMHKYTSLQYLQIEKCPKLHCFPPGGLPENLKILQITRVKINEGIQDWGLHRLHSLQYLVLRYIVKTQKEDLNLSLSSSSLNKIVIEDIQNLKNLSVVNGTNLNSLEIRNCLNLESLDGNFTSLEKLSLLDCPKLQSFPPIVSPFIRKLELRNLGSSTDGIEQILGPDLELPSSSRELYISGFQNLKTISWSTLQNLTELSIFDCPKFESFGDTALPPQLKQVYIEDCEMIRPHLQSDPHNGIIRMDGNRYSLC